MLKVNLNEEDINETKDADKRINKKTKILIVIAHPDDEVLWAYPIMQDDTFERYLLCVSDNHQNPRYIEAVQALKNVCETTNTKYVDCMYLKSNFYQLPTRAPIHELNMITVASDIVSQIEHTCVQYDIADIFTHNILGEYGHGDHKMLWDIVTRLWNYNVWFTDIHLFNKTHISCDIMPTWARMIYRSAELQGCVLMNDVLYNRLRREYELAKAWSWNNKIITQCNIYKLHNGTLGANKDENIRTDQNT